MVTRLIRCASLAAVLAMFGTGVSFADAGGAGTETFTEHAHDVPLFEFTAPNPCTGTLGTFSATAKNFVFHITTHEDGEFWLTGTATGSTTFTPAEEGGVSYTGHFTTWFGGALNEKNSVEHDTTTFVLTGSDGSHVVVHGNDHLSTNGNGEVTVEFEKMHASCR
jgi:hypothetical protein